MASADDSTTANADNNHNKLYKGVRKRKWGKWVSEIRLPNSRERIWLGSYDSPEKAARAFDAALYCLRGRHANFNFPDTPFNLDINVVAAGNGNQSLTPQEIQAVAAKFANELDPPHDHDHDHDHDQEQEPEPLQLTQGCRGSGDSSITETSCGTVQVDNMDWTFLNVLDHEYNEVGSDYGFYSGLDKMHSGELFYNSSLPPPSPPFEDNINGYNEIEGGDAFSHHSFLWNWNF